MWHSFQVTIGRKFAPLICLRDHDIGIDAMITTYKTAVADTANEMLGKVARKSSG